MTTFRVGQRVRLKYLRDPIWNFLAGREGQIVAVGDFPASKQHRLAHQYKVRIVGFQRLGGFIGSQLDPIIPEGMQPVSWESCLWQPEGVAA